MAAQAPKVAGDPESGDGTKNKEPSISTQITKADLTAALETLSNSPITTWQHTADSVLKDIQELGKQTLHMEEKCNEFATAHNDLANNVEQMAEKITLFEEKMADMEDRGRPFPPK
ncbi:Hypothetical predicted protein [Pelobates cultripes]|uniref:Uncharacterized protein n=1 Tax=Pelobates cultripes TaxID=61616 RepID=A0AAD1WM72_PELCU|nr:Hypothetical predicted protein [Pelobates cultripes]